MWTKLISLKDASEGCKDVFAYNGVDIGQLIVGDDGFWVYWPDSKRQGFWASHMMRALADAMDELNKPWEDEINKYFEQNPSLPNVS
jgi:hypothetical protein